MLSFILSLINPLKAITQEITKVKLERIKAESNDKKIEFDERLKTLESRRDVILKAQSDPFERWVRIGFAVPFILYVWKLVIWDKIFQLGVTDNLSSDLWHILWIVLGGYFIDVAIKRFKS